MTNISLLLFLSIPVILAVLCHTIFVMSRKFMSCIFMSCNFICPAFSVNPCVRRSTRRADDPHLQRAAAQRYESRVCLRSPHPGHSVRNQYCILLGALVFL